MAMAELVTLNAGRLRLQLSPSIGGSISALEWLADDCAWPILRNCNSPLQNVLDAACFPLVPYVNRIRGGRFSFRGREIRLKPNMPGDPSPLHGQGWLNAWMVDESDNCRAVFAYHHQAGECAWDYEARQEFSLDERRLTVRVTCWNRSNDPMPCGLGQHPYFPCGRDTRIDTSVTSAWTIDEHVLPVEKVAAEGRYDLRKRLVCGQDLDNGFDRWDGLAWMGDPGWPFDLLLSSSAAGFFQLYSPPEGGIFVAEPVTHANAALNAPESEWPELGMRVLEPGREMSLDMRLELVPK